MAISAIPMDPSARIWVIRTVFTDIPSCMPHFIHSGVNIRRKIPIAKGRYPANAKDTGPRTIAARKARNRLPVTRMVSRFVSWILSRVITPAEELYLRPSAWAAAMASMLPTAIFRILSKRLYLCIYTSRSLYDPYCLSLSVIVSQLTGIHTSQGRTRPAARPAYTPPECSASLCSAGMLRQISIQYGRCQSNQRLAGARLVVGFGPVRRYEAVLSRSLQAQTFPAQQRSRPLLLRLSCPDTPVPAGQQRTGCPPAGSLPPEFSGKIT